MGRLHVGQVRHHLHPKRTAEVANLFEAAPLFARGLVRLPNHPKLLRELRLLEKRPHRSGKDTVDHGRNGNDDHSNSVCGVLRMLSANKGYDPCSESFYRAWLQGFGDDPGPEETKRRQEADNYNKSLMEQFGRPASAGPRRDFA